MKKLYLAREDKKILGVCGGIGESYGVDPTLVRLLWVAGTLVTGVFPGVIAYVVAWLIIPMRPISDDTITPKI